MLGLLLSRSLRVSGDSGAGTAADIDAKALVVLERWVPVDREAFVVLDRWVPIDREAFVVLGRWVPVDREALVFWIDGYPSIAKRLWFWVDGYPSGAKRWWFWIDGGALEGPGARYPGPVTDGFERRMRRRSRVSSAARIAFAIFALAGIVGGAAMRFSRGCRAGAPAPHESAHRP